MKRVALGLLLAAAALYVVATVQRPNHAAWGYVAAFSEAAMVGALADWFAVVALFRHPLGLPIPHTAIIAANKDRIGHNLAAFIATHFLATDQVLARLRHFDAAGSVGQWLCRGDNAGRIAARFAGVGSWIVKALDDARVHALVVDFTRASLHRIDVAQLAARMLEALTEGRRHQELLDGVLAQIARWLGERAVQERIGEAIAREVKALKYVGLDHVAARVATRKVVVIIARTLLEMVEDPQHELRLRFDALVADYVRRLQHDAALQQHARRLRDDLLANPAVARSVYRLWSRWLRWLQADLHRDGSRTQMQMAAAVRAMGERIAADAALRQWLNAEFEGAVPRLLERWRDLISGYIEARVHAWDAVAMSHELERHIGHDLQYIRINGTLVGGAAGLLIYSATQWWL